MDSNYVDFESGVYCCKRCRIPLYARTKALLHVVGWATWMVGQYELQLLVSFWREMAKSPCISILPKCWSGAAIVSWKDGHDVLILKVLPSGILTRRVKLTSG